jgi:hypothetical protein
MGQNLPQKNDYAQTYEQIKSILVEARNRAYRAINREMVLAYWEIGRIIVEEEQQGLPRAEYGRKLIPVLSKRLKSEFGKGFDPSNLAMMRAFHLAYPNFDALRQELTWTHYRLLLRVESTERGRFMKMKPSLPDGQPGSWNGRFTPCFPSDWR